MISSMRLRNSGVNRVSAAFITSPLICLISPSDFLAEAERLLITLEILASEVRRHDDDRVGKVNLLAAAVRDPAFVKGLEEDVHQIRRSFFNLVKQRTVYGLSRSCSVRMPPRSAADDAARHADELFDADGAVAVFRHVDADHLRLVAEHEFGDGLCKLRLADAGRARKSSTPSGA